MFKLIKYLFILIFVTILAAVFFAAGVYFEFIEGTPEAPPGRNVVIEIEPGSNLERISVLLEANKIVKDARKFHLYTRIRFFIQRETEGKTFTLKAGEYAFSTGWTPEKVLSTLLSGKVILHKLAIPEGLPWWKVAALVEESGLGTYRSFAEKIKDADLLKRFQIPAKNAEGYLYPDTYLLPRPKNKDAGPIVEAMLGAFQKNALPKIRQVKGDISSKEIYDLVRLASLVEKETGVADERAIVAGVYANRLRIGMLLQCDPTIIYGLGENFDGNIRKSDLQNPANRYNTYVHPGLPPGPIGSPGLQSILAAASPAKVSYLYFVAKGDGSHYFSDSLDEHNHAVRKYQLKR